MSDRKDWFYGQVVQEDELDDSQANLETADLNQSIDLGFCATDVSLTEGGIMKGLVASDGGGLVASISAGAAYDNSGRRIAVALAKSLNLTNAGDSTTGAGGTCDGASITPASGDHRWISVYITFDRALSDVREDDNSQQVYFDRAESFYFTIAAGTSVTKPTEPTNLPALQSGSLLLADIKIDDTSIESINEERRQVWLRADSTLTAPVTRGGTGFPKRGLQTSSTGASITTPVKEAFLQLLGYYNDHVRNDGSTSDKHDADNIVFDPTDLSIIEFATDVQAAITALDAELSDLFSRTNYWTGLQKFNVIDMQLNNPTPSDGYFYWSSATNYPLLFRLNSQSKKLTEAGHTRTFRYPIMNGEFHDIHGDVGWVWKPITCYLEDTGLDTGGGEPVKIAAPSYYGLNRFLKDSVTLTKIRTRVTPASIRADENKMKVTLYKDTDVMKSAYDDGTTSAQNIDVTINTVLDTQYNMYYVRVDTGAGGSDYDRIHYMEVSYTDDGYYMDPP